MTRYYTNIADSIMESQFSTHKKIVHKSAYCDSDDSFYDESWNITDMIMTILEQLDKTKNNYELIFTLNQIADNPAIITDDFNTKSFCSLFEKNKILISTYNGFEIVTYIANRLVSALKRIYKDSESQKNDSELRFICSLFPALGEGAYTRLKSEKIKLILGDIYDFHYNRKFFTNVNNNINRNDLYRFLLDNIKEYDEKNYNYGYFTALHKIFSVPLTKDECLNLIEKIPLIFDEKECKHFRCIMKNICSLNAAASGKYESNSTFLKNYKVFKDIPEKATLCKVIRSFINNSEIFNEKVDFWFNGIPKKYENYKESIIDILKTIMCNFSKLASGRSAMYDRIEKEIDAYLLSAEDELKELFKRSSYTNRNNREHHKTARSILCSLVKITIDFCYNIHNALLSNTEKRMLEAEYIISFEDGYMNITNITNATYDMDSYGKLLRTSREEIEYVL